jgi:PAS domain S-box-containing protein
MTTGSRSPAGGDVPSLFSGYDDFRQLFDQATESICIADIETGIILDCNPAFLHLTGYERSEVLGMPQARLHPPEDGNPPVTENFASHRTSRAGEVLHERLRTKTGEIRDVEVKAGPIVVGGRRLMHGFFRDVTDELRDRREREMTLNLVRLLNDRNHTHELIRSLTDYLQKWTGCSAVGVRLREGDDFPYFESRGFSGEFVEAENYLCQRDLDGQIVRDDIGNAVLDCMCGNILCGRFDPKQPFFTARGSFWSNCTTQLLASTTEADRQARTRNRCNGAGYESVALIAIRHRDQVFGLLQFNDRTPGRFTPDLIAFLEYAADQIAISLAQRQTQSALEASEDRYRRLFEVESDTIFLVDCESQRFIDANGAATELYGYRREEFLAMTVGDVSAEPDKSRQAVADEESKVRLRWHRKKDGTVFPVEIAGSYFEHRGRKLHVATIRDITARREAETSLRESEKKYRSLFESSLDAVFFSVPNGRILAVNEAACQTFGMTEQELLEANRDKLLDTGDSRYQAALEERTRTGRILCELTGIRKDGSKFPVEVNSVLLDGGTRSFVIMRDITRRKQYESRLVEANERLELAKKAAGAGVWDLDVRTNRLEWSPEMHAMFGLEPSAAGHSMETFRSAIHPDDRAAAIGTLECDIRERDSHQMEFRIVTPGGEVRWMSGMGLITREGTEPIRVTGVCMDITDRKRMEESLRESEQRYRKLFENMSEAFAHHRMIFEDGVPSDYVFLSANKTFEAMTGLKDVVGKRVTEVLPGVRQSDPQLFEVYGRVASTGQPEKYETYVDATNAWYQISVYSPTPGEFVTVFEDITARKRSEIALRSSEELFSKAFHGSPHVMVITAMADWRIIDVNEAFERITEHGRSDVLGHDFRSLGLFADLAAVARATRDLVQNGKYSGRDFVFRTRSGKSGIARLSAETVEIAGERCALTVAEDITERRRTEDALKKSEALFSKAFHGSPVAMTISSMLDQRIIDVNDAFVTQSGYPRDTIIGRTPQESMIMVDQEEIKRLTRLLVAQGGIRNVESPYRTRSGELRFAHFSAEIVEVGDEPCLLTAAEDITERQRASEALRASEERFRQMFDHMGSGMIVYDAVDDGEDFIIKEFNPAAERIAKTGRAEVIGRRVSEAFPGLKEIGLFQTFQRVWRTGVPEQHPANFYRDDRFTVWVENYVVRLPTGEVVAIFDDITERKNSEAELQKNRAELVHASRLAAMGALTAGIAHEINQPLAIMATWVEVAAREIRDRLNGDKQEALLALKRIDAAMERSSSVIQHMRDFARKSEPRVADVSILDAIDEVRELIDHQLRVSGVALCVEIGDRVPAVLADRTQLQQVLVNLILNAIEALEGVEATVRRIVIQAITNGGMLEVAVSDSGNSMTLEKLESVFEPFRSTKSSGLGLGLSICRTIVQWHGGRIWAACDAERGTTFTFTLPIAKEDSRHATQTHHLHRGRRAGSARSRQPPGPAD